jgi:DNA-binding MarR family transcriptional regulator
VAEELGISEPSASRMTGVLVTAGLLEVRPGEGNSRRLSLTPDGERLVDRCRSLLEKRFADLVEQSGVTYADYARDTARLLAAISR